MAEQLGSQHFNNTTINDNARVHMGNVHHHHYASSADEEVADEEATKSAIRTALFITDPSVDRQSLIDKKGHRVAGTCEWVERNETYQAWLCGDPSLLWIFGGPGKGKTMLSIYLTQQFEKVHCKEAIYFFCSSEHTTRSTATAILRTLLWQLMVIRPGIINLISPYFDPPERIQAMLSTPGTLWEIFAKVIQSSGFGRMQCLIDGLDECEDESCRWLASQFAELSSQPNNSSLHIIIASRHMSSAKHIKQLRLDPDNDQNVSDDIEKFTSVKMEELSQRLDLTTTFCSRIQSQLLAKAGGTFLWIGYAMIELRSKRTILEVEEAVKELPTALPALYGRMLRRIPTGRLDLIITLLHWVTLAVRPLSIGELEDLVAGRVPEHMDARQALRDYIKLCEPMIVVQQDMVLLVHQSAKDYFLRDTKNDDVVAERVRASFADAQASLTKKCLGALEKDSPLSGYGMLHWMAHFRRCSKSVQISLVNDESFFGEGSASRHNWWEYWGQFLIVPGGRSKELPRLHTACFLGLEVWAQQILTEVSSTDSSRTMGKRVSLKWRHDMATPRKPNSVNYTTLPGGWAPLHYAVRAKPSHDIVSFLLSNGADIGLHAKFALSPLAMAVEFGAQLDTLGLLLASGADLEGDYETNGLVTCTPLRRAVELREEESAMFLINAGANIRAADCIRGAKPSLTVLQSAAQRGLPAVVRLLIKLGANPHVAEGGAPIPLCLAINGSKTEVVDILLEHSASQSVSQIPHENCASWPLYTALARRDLDVARKIIRFGIVRTTCSSETLTLWAAVLDSNVADVTAALKQGVSPNAPMPDSLGSPSGLTSLHLAVVEWQHRGYNTFTLEHCGAIVRRLLEHGADPSLQDAAGKTALQRAEAKGRVWAAMASLIAKSTTKGATSAAGCNLDLLRTGGRR